MRTFLLLTASLAAAFATTADAQRAPLIGALTVADRSAVRGESIESASEWGFVDGNGEVFFYAYENHEENSDGAVVRTDGRLHVLRQVSAQDVERRGRQGTVKRFATSDGSIAVSAVVIWDESDRGDCGYGTGGIAVTRRGREATRNLDVVVCAAVYGAFGE